MGRLVVVTGGAKGIGLAVVRRFTALGDEVVALAVVFLASPAAVAINGQALVIDGGGLQA